MQRVYRAFVVAAALVFWRPCHAELSSLEVSKYAGGQSTALQAVVGIAMANKVPVGVVLGVKPTLCGQTRDYRFSGKSVGDALRMSIEGTGYELSNADGVYRISAPDPSPGERKTVAYIFPSFASSLDTMSGVGAWLTGWIQDVIEGSGGFFGSHLGGLDDEHLHLPELRKVTASQVADAVVKMKGHGLWVMQAFKLNSPPKPGSTRMSIYSYHDLQGNAPAISCVEAKLE